MKAGRRSAAVAASALASVMALVVLLSGCAQGGTSGASSAPGAAASAGSRAGQCRVVLDPVEFDAVSNSSPTVDCAAQHTVETFDVVELEGFDPEAGRPDELLLKARAGQLCAYDAMRDYIGARDRDSSRDLRIVAFAPTAREWGDGARSVRCDLAVLENERSLVSVTGSLRDIMERSDSSALRRCYLTAPGEEAGSGSETTCDEEHTAEDVNAWLPARTGNPAAEDVPGRCAPFVRQFFAPGPVPADTVVSGILRQDGEGGAWTLRCTAAQAPGAPGPMRGSYAVG
ncbi:septum formation family protein [Compostimonas suwonensis]|uniref:Putative regulator of septum formation n=1 Tax=Compostimonas suwonensis TaxID=1048394 RepID=A0A2M9BUD1_9MICO|nr:septum formation family protein [Compostimonas suwonensis]PJJ61531.1 putative regulator of septum formation [Compostimonas suwonensis]